jgi:hypothetical protein
MRNLARLIVLALLLALPAAALAAGHRGRVLVSNCGAVQYRPKRIVLSCGDGSNFLAKLTWTSWTATKATGAGVDEVNDCRPACDTGHLHAYPVAVTLSRPVRCKKRVNKLFGRIKLVYGKRHPGPARIETGRLLCSFP